MEQINSFAMRRPDELHVHLREDPVLSTVVPFTAHRFGRALIMPNLVPPITDMAHAQAYKDRIMAAAPDDHTFVPLMTCYLTDETRIGQLQRGFKTKVFAAAKLYPAGATTNSHAGVTSIEKIHHVLAVMEKIGMPLCIHGETVKRNGKSVDPYDREWVFIETELVPLRAKFPGLKIILEHVTTRDGVAYIVAEGCERLAATVTAHHLWISRGDVFEGGISTDYHCLPVIKRAEDRDALRRVVTSGNPHFFLGTDSAPHFESQKRKHRAPGGIFTAHAAIELYAQVFEEEGHLENLESFASVNGANFYGLSLNEGTITLCREPWTVDKMISVANTDDFIRPFLYEERPEDRPVINWRLQTEGL